MRTRSFNQGRGLQEEDDMPTPPIRTASTMQQQNSYSTMPNRRGPQSRPSLAGAGLNSPHSRPAPMKPPSAPPPPPPSAHPPPPPHRTQPAPPPPPPMQSPYAKVIKTALMNLAGNFIHASFCTFQPSQPLNSSVQSSGGSAPPTPPTRRHSLRANNGSGSNSGSGGETFESRFSHLFKAPQYLPPPEPFSQCAKTYPSRNQQQRTSADSLFDEKRHLLRPLF